jgi:hypothetical protein
VKFIGGKKLLFLLGILTVNGGLSQTIGSNRLVPVSLAIDASDLSKYFSDTDSSREAFILGYIRAVEDYLVSEQKVPISKNLAKECSDSIGQYGRARLCGEFEAIKKIDWYKNKVSLFDFGYIVMKGDGEIRMRNNQMELRAYKSREWYLLVGRQEVLKDIAVGCNRFEGKLSPRGIYGVMYSVLEHQLKIDKIESCLDRKDK